MENLSLFDLTKKLMMVQAPSGREHALAETIRALLEPMVDECWIDNVGNLVGLLRGCGEKKKKLLYAAHMDEVGFVVTMIDGNGFVHFGRVGNTHLTSAAYREVYFMNGVHGMIIPVSDANLKEDAMVVDIGVNSKSAAEMLVSVGDFFTTVPDLRVLTGSVIAGRPIDDRIGCAIELLALKRIADSGSRPYHDVYFAFTVQEETALPAIGGLVLANAIQPDAAIAIDVCQTADTPDAPQMDTWLGKGASILVRDTTLIADKALTDDMVAAAKEAGIPYQLLVALEGGTDAVPMQQAGRGCRVNVLSVPMKYLHTSAEMADLADAENVLDLTVLLCNRPFSF